jgi:hypothetical protein
MHCTYGTYIAPMVHTIVPTYLGISLALSKYEIAKVKFDFYIFARFGMLHRVKSGSPDFRPSNND